jgi:hypothetical protein
LTRRYFTALRLVMDMNIAYVIEEPLDMFFRRLIAGFFIFLWRGIIRLIPARGIRALARLLFSKSWGRFQVATANPRKAQETALLSIVQRNRYTVFGKEHSFGSIKSIEDFQKIVPISTYDNLEPYILRMTRGEKNVLVAGPVPYFARTSGTTGPSKYIPINERYLEEFRTGRRVWVRQVAQAYPQALRGTMLTMQSPRIEGTTEGGTPYGSITISMGVVDVGRPRKIRREGRQEILEPFQKIPMSIFYIEDFNTKYYVLLRLAVVTNISVMATINPSTLILLCRKLTEFAPDLIRDCEQGTLKADLKLEPDLRRKLEKRMKKNRKVAARIRASLEQHGRVRPPDVWKRLCGMICWKGGAAPFYLRQFPEWFGDLPVMDYGFVATEGNFSVVLSTQGSHGVAAVTGHFFEFIEEEKRGDESPPVLTVEQLEVGKRYYILVTGSHGLYRYDMNDIVEVVGKYKNTPEIVFCHKGGNMISFTGEKIAESQVVQAVSSAQESAGITLNGFCVTIRLDQEHPRYVFAVEPTDQMTEEKLGELLNACEKNLQEANIEYRAKRTSLRLGDPLLAVVRNGAFECWRQEKIKAGAFDSHVKTPHLSRDPSILEQLGIERELECKRT